MIKSIEIINLQSHRHTKLNFCVTTNAITGPSDSGKSAIFRSFGFVVNNSPNNIDDLLSKWCKDNEEVHVIIETYEGHIIERIRSKSKNLYILNGAELKAFGQGVPEDIQKILNISELNFQTQYEKPFLLSYTPPEISRFINRLIDLEDIDIYFSEVGTDKKNISISLKNSKKQLDLQIEKLLLYDNLSTIEKEYEIVKEIHNRIEYVKTWITTLYNLSSKIIELQGRKKHQLKILSQKDNIKNCFNDIERCNEINNRKNELLKQINLFDSISKKINCLIIERKKYKYILKYRLQIKELNDLYSKIVKKTEQLETIESLSRRIKFLLGQRETLLKQKNENNDEIDKLLSENNIKNCLFCGAVLKEK